jgi:cephalosporin hydroxylase
MRIFMLFVYLFFFASIFQAQQRAVTDTGEEIILNTDGTWKHLEEKTDGIKTNNTEFEKKVVDLYHQAFYNSQNTWRLNKWLGILTEQNPNDVWITQEIIVETRPDFIIETGTLCGGSAALWSTILEQVNPKGRVITIDILDQAQEARKLPIVQKHVDFLHGSSTATDIVDYVKYWVEGKKVLVILDSDHSKQHVLKELAAYAPLVAVGSYLIVQDTNVNGHPVDRTFGPGPMEAVTEFLAANSDFVSDTGRERFMFTMNPNGYLKRIR